MQAEMFESINSFYSKLIQGIDGKTVSVTRDYEDNLEGLDQPSAHALAKLPLPATFTKDVSRKITEAQSGGRRMQVRLFSDYPWPPSDKSPAEKEKDDETLRRLRDQDDDSVTRSEGRIRFTEILPEEDGKWLRHVEARIMEESCLKCHNVPGSPKTGWKVGDVRGAVEILRPLDPPYKLKRARYWKYIMVASAAVVIMGLSTAMMQIRRRRTSV